MKHLIDIFKALSNDYRLQILQLLKSPSEYFLSEHMATAEHNFEGGVCVGAIAEKTGLAQSVISNYLNTLHDTGLIECKRVSKWTYYRYNTQAVTEFLQHLQQLL